LSKVRRSGVKFVIFGVLPVLLALAIDQLLIFQSL
jgi:hypothetical protein